MSNRTLLTTIVALVALFATGATPAAGGDPGIRHRVFMAGSVIESSAARIYLCIGTAEGARVGQELVVVRITRDRSLSPKQGTRFKHEEVGTVRIDAIVDEHFAEATVISGKAKKGDIVRLSDSADPEEDE